jgi:hypothetical protein
MKKKYKMMVSQICNHRNITDTAAIESLLDGAVMRLESALHYKIPFEKSEHLPHLMSVEAVKMNVKVVDLVRLKKDLHSKEY